jgi:hypothetical protein
MGGVCSSRRETNMNTNFGRKSEGSHCGNLIMNEGIAKLDMKARVRFNWQEMCPSDRRFSTKW